MALPRAAHVARSTARRVVWPLRQIALASETRCEGDLAFASARRFTNDWRSQPTFGGEEFMGDNGGRALPSPTASPSLLTARKYCTTTACTGYSSRPSSSALTPRRRLRTNRARSPLRPEWSLFHVIRSVTRTVRVPCGRISRLIRASGALYCRWRRAADKRPLISSHDRVELFVGEGRRLGRRLGARRNRLMRHKSSREKQEAR